MAARKPKEGQDEEGTSCGKKCVIIGTVIIFVAAVGSAAVVYYGLWSVPTCRVIRQARAKEQDISKEFDVSVINDCERDFDCPFDILTCQIPCPLGFKMDKNRCPISCECALTSRGTFQGDIQFDDTEAAGLLMRYGHTSIQQTFAVFSSSVRQSIILWPKSPDGRVKVPYVIIDELMSEINLIQEAFAVYSRETCVDFVPKTSEHYYINFVKEVGCWSRLGRGDDGPQKISLSDSCMALGFLLHEMMHAIGFDHEHVRPDRDGFITIDRVNVIPDQHMNFAKIREPVKKLGSPYDVASATHVSSLAWIISPDVYSFVKADGNPILGQTDMLSREDIREINTLYHCFDITGVPGGGPRPPGGAGQGGATPAPGQPSPPTESPGLSPDPGQSSPPTESPGLSPDPGQPSPQTESPGLSPDPGQSSPPTESPGLSPDPGQSSPPTESPGLSPDPGQSSPPTESPGLSPDPGQSSPPTESPGMIPDPGQPSPEAPGVAGSPVSKDGWVWTDWGPWSSCVETCGKTWSYRYRRCENPNAPDEIGGYICEPGFWYDQTPCTEDPCLEVLGTWGEWLSWSTCTRPCGGGFRSRQRICPEGGERCNGYAFDSGPCPNEPCPTRD